MSQDVQIVFNHLPAMSAAAGHAVSAVIHKTTLDLEAAMKLSMSGSKSGRVYKRGKGGTKTHQASAPGQAPAIDAGDLAGSIVGRMNGEREGQVAVSSDHAAAMEYGTKHIAARPFIKPAVEEARPKLHEAIEHALQEL